MVKFYVPLIYYLLSPNRCARLEYLLHNFYPIPISGISVSDICGIMLGQTVRDRLLTPATTVSCSLD